MGRSLLFTLSAALLFTGCFEQGRDRSTVQSTRNNSDIYANRTPSGGAIALPAEGSESGGSSEGGSGSGDSGTNFESLIPEEIKHCQWSADGITGFQLSSNAHLGPHTLCQSKTVNTDVFVQVKNPIVDAQVCIIPTYASNNASVYIGEPRCLMLNDNKKIYKVSLLKNRPGYGNFNVNGVMVMKDKAFFYPAPFYQHVLSPDAYLFCSQFLDQYGDPSYCNSFKSVGQYHYKAF